MPTVPSYRGRPLPDHADVVVIGGGYMGINAARVLARGGAAVTLLEAEHLGRAVSVVDDGSHRGVGLRLRTARERKEEVDHDDHSNKDPLGARGRRIGTSRPEEAGRIPCHDDRQDEGEDGGDRVEGCR